MKLTKIKIIFEDENEQVIVQGEAPDVLYAEGELQILARAYMKKLEEADRVIPEDHELHDCKNDENGEGHCDNKIHKEQ